MSEGIDGGLPVPPKHALLTSIVFAFEEYEADHLAHVVARDAATADVASLDAEAALVEVREWLDTETPASHQGFPVLDADGLLVGVVTRRDLLAAHAPRLAAGRREGASLQPRQRQGAEEQHPVRAHGDDA